MKNFLVKNARKIIAENIYCTLATTDLDGKPWISPLYFNYDPKTFNIYWVSAKDCLHSMLIKKNNRVAITIFDSHAPEGTGNAVYIEGKAFELTRDELPDAIRIFYGGRHHTASKARVKKPQDFVGSSPIRMYKVIPQRFYTLTEGKYVDGKYIDERVKIALLK